MKIRSDIKDYLIAREMLGSNSKEDCHLIKKLRTKGIITPLCDGWSTISLDEDDCGWIICNDLLEE